MGENFEMKAAGGSLRDAVHELFLGAVYFLNAMPSQVARINVFYFTPVRKVLPSSQRSPLNCQMQNSACADLMF